MTRTLTRLAALAACALLAACGGPALDPTFAPAPAADAGPAAEHGVPAALRPAWNGLIAAWNGDDAEALSRYFAEDAVVSAGGELRGRATIRDQWLAPNLAGTSAVRPTPTAFRIAGDEIHEEGTYVITTVDGQSQSGRYTHAWGREADGSWKVRAMTLTPG